VPAAGEPDTQILERIHLGPLRVAPLAAIWNNPRMIIGDRLRSLRIEKKLSQGDVEKRTGLLRVYISRVENDHTVPSVETLEKFARALQVPLYVLFYDGEEPPKPPQLLKRKGGGNHSWGNAGKDRLALTQFRRLLSRIRDEDQRLLLFIASKMALRRTKR
jgi:transcriptional regulator with XRE-family HTH domain